MELAGLVFMLGIVVVLTLWLDRGRADVAGSGEGVPLSSSG